MFAAPPRSLPTFARPAAAPGLGPPSRAQGLERQQIDGGLQQVGGVAVPERVSCVLRPQAIAHKGSPPRRSTHDRFLNVRP